MANKLLGKKGDASYLGAFCKVPQARVLLLRAGVTNWHRSGVAKFIFPVYKLVSEIIALTTVKLVSPFCLGETRPFCVEN